MKNLVRVRFEVTAKDIKEGKHADSMQCMVARAFKRILRPSCFGGTCQDAACIKTPKETEWSDYRHKPSVSKKISAFDGRGSVKPFAFEMKVPSDAIRLSVLKALGV